MMSVRYLHDRHRRSSLLTWILSGMATYSHPIGLNLPASNNAKQWKPGSRKGFLYLSCSLCPDERYTAIHRLQSIIRANLLIKQIGPNLQYRIVDPQWKT